jgi:hypothetical protein
MMTFWGILLRVFDCLIVGIFKYKTLAISMKLHTNSENLYLNPSSKDNLI